MKPPYLNTHVAPKCDVRKRVLFQVLSYVAITNKRGRKLFSVDAPMQKGW